MHKSWLATLPKKVILSKVIVIAPGGDWVVVKPNYKSSWQLPGGAVESGESPLVGAEREVAEELGVALTDYRLSFIDHYAPTDHDDTLIFYWQATISQSALEEIKLPPVELSEFRVCPPAQAQALLAPATQQKLATYLAQSEADRQGVVLLDNGEVPA